jgi:hypothetical protein
LNKLARSTGAPGEWDAGVAPQIHSLEAGPRQDRREVVGQARHEEGFCGLGRLRFEGARRQLGQERLCREEFAVDDGPKHGGQEERSEADQADQAASCGSQEGDGVDQVGAEQVPVHQVLGVLEIETYEGSSQQTETCEGRPEQDLPGQGCAGEGCAQQGCTDQSCTGQSCAGEEREECADEGGSGQGRNEVICDKGGSDTDEGRKDVDQAVEHHFVSNGGVSEQGGNYRI